VCIGAIIINNTNSAFAGVSLIGVPWLPSAGSRPGIGLIVFMKNTPVDDGLIKCPERNITQSKIQCSTLNVLLLTSLRSQTAIYCATIISAEAGLKVLEENEIRGKPY
jgi:hypothetical protein